MRIEIHHYIHQDNNDSQVIKFLKQILNINTNIMSKVTDIEAKVDALQATLDAEQEQIQTAIDSLNDTVNELREQIAGGGADNEALDRIATKLDSIKADLEESITPEEPEQPQA